MGYQSEQSQSRKEAAELPDSDYVVNVWFERDRRCIALDTPDGKSVFTLCDDDVDQAIEEGLLTMPLRFKLTDEDWHVHAVDYARNRGLIK